MSSQVRPTTWQRNRRAVAVALVVALASGVVLFVVSSRSTGGPADATDGRVHKVGDGTLPTERPTLRAARAPLSPAETGYAARVAAESTQIPDGATNVRGEAGPQVLFIDLPRIAEAQGSQRLVTVMLYDYTSDRGYQLLVDLTTDEVTKAGTDPMLQPPPAADEADVALEIALASDADLTFRRQFEEANGVPLLATDQVSHKAGIWTFDESSLSGRECGKHRCVRLLVKDPSGAFFDTGDFVVDLSEKSIVSIH